MVEISTDKLRLQIMKDRGMVPPKPKKIKLPIIKEEEEFIEIPLFPKMLYIQEKYGIKVRIDIFRGSINDVCSRYKWEIDRSTISRWRKYIRGFILEEVKK